MNRMNSLCALMTLALFAGVGSAVAEPVSVIYGDLNLASPAEASIFKLRVDEAGKMLCRNAAHSAGVATIEDRKQCMDAVRQEALEALPRDQRVALGQAVRAQQMITTASRVQTAAGI